MGFSSTGASVGMGGFVATASTVGNGVGDAHPAVMRMLIKKDNRDNFIQSP
jgi:hypothetical protein